jgi:hypothetical protein
MLKLTTRFYILLRLRAADSDMSKSQLVLMDSEKFYLHDTTPFVVLIKFHVVLHDKANLMT